MYIRFASSTLNIAPDLINLWRHEFIMLRCILWHQNLLSIWHHFMRQQFSSNSEFIYFHYGDFTLSRSCRRFHSMLEVSETFWRILCVKTEFFRNNFYNGEASIDMCVKCVRYSVSQLYYGVRQMCVIWHASTVFNMVCVNCVLYGVRQLCVI